MSSFLCIECLMLVSQWPVVRLKAEKPDSASGRMLLYWLSHSGLFSL